MNGPNVHGCAALRKGWVCTTALGTLLRHTLGAPMSTQTLKGAPVHLSLHVWIHSKLAAHTGSVTQRASAPGAYKAMRGAWCAEGDA